MKLSLEGKVAVITGGSRGIGAATVRMFVGAGARVLFNYEKARSAAEKLMADLGADRCAAVQCSLSGTKTAKQMTAGSKLIVNTLKNVIETGRPSFGVRCFYMLFGLLEPIMPKHTRVENWPLERTV